MPETPNLAPGWTASFREWFGLTRCEARVLTALYRAHGLRLRPLDLALVSGIASEGAVRTHISRVRSALKAEGIDCETGRGYRLTEVGQAECRVAIINMASELDVEL